jgi:hypothetical protein
MTSARLWTRAACQAMRRKPQTYEQAWFRAVFVGATTLIGSVIAVSLSNWPQPWPIYVFLATASSFLSSGLAFSYGVSQQEQR